MKLVGAIFVVLGGFGIGKSKCKKLKERYDNLREFLVCVQFLQGQMELGNKPLGEIFEEMGKKRPWIFGWLFCRVSKELQQLEGKLFREIWETNIDSRKTDQGLKKEDWEYMKTMGAILGVLDITSQQKQLEVCEREIKRTIEEARIQWKEKERLLPKLGMISGMAIVLILL